LEFAGLTADSDIQVHEMSRWFLFHTDKCVSCKPHAKSKKVAWDSRSCSRVFVVFQERKRTHHSDDIRFAAASAGFEG
jgi:hypothetical protein